MENLTNKMKFTTTLACVQCLVRKKGMIKEEVITLEQTQDKYIISWQEDEGTKLELCSTIYKNTAYRMFREIVSNDINEFIRYNQDLNLF